MYVDCMPIGQFSWIILSFKTLSERGDWCWHSECKPLNIYRTTNSHFASRKLRSLNRSIRRAKRSPITFNKCTSHGTICLLRNPLITQNSEKRKSPKEAYPVWENSKPGLIEAVRQ